MINARENGKSNYQYKFPSTKSKNVTCVHCKHQFFVREWFCLRGSQIPLLMECGHPVCLNCSKLCTSKPCPLCQTVARINDGVQYPYPLNLYALGLIVASQNSLKRYREPDISFSQPAGSKLKQSQASGFCQECGIMAAAKCLQCCSLFCNACYSKIHGRALQSHSKIMIENTIIDTSFMTVNKCTDNCNEILGYYCKECEQAGCSHCMLRLHAKHDYVTLEEKNLELLADFHLVYDQVAEGLQRIHQTQKKLQTIQMFPSELHNSESVQATISQHFAQLHGVLQNLEMKMLNKLKQQHDNFAKNLDKIVTKLKAQEDTLRSSLLVAAAAKDSLDKIDIRRVIKKLKELVDIPVHLTQDPVSNDQKFTFNVDKNIIEAIEKHCNVEIPFELNYDLLQTDNLPKDYVLEPLKLEANSTDDESIIKSESTVSTVLCKRTRDGEVLSDYVKISHIVNPSHFYVQYLNTQKDMDSMNAALEKCVSSVESFAVEDINVGVMSIVYYESLNRLHRGQINAINKDDDDKVESCNVHYVDYGYTEDEVPMSRIYKISDQLEAIPWLAVRCALYNIVPNGDQWSKDAIEAFRTRTESFLIPMYVVHTRDNVRHVDFDINTNTAEGVTSIRDTLIFLEHGNLISLQKLMKQNPSSVYRFYPEELKLETFVDVTVRHVITPNNIYVTKIGENQDYISKLLQSMTAHYNLNINTPTLTCVPEIGIPCAAQDVNNKWYRGKIIEILKNKMVKVFNVDNGHIATVHANSIRRLTNAYVTGRTQAINVRLKGVTPLSKGVWTLEILMFLKKNLTLENVQIIAFKKNDDYYDVCLYKQDNVNFSSILVANNLAACTDLNSQSPITNEKPAKAKKAHIRRYKSQKEDKLSSITMDLISNCSNTSRNEHDPFKVCINIFRVESPDSIYVSDASRKIVNDAMMDAMQEFYGKFHSLQQNAWKEGAVCAVYSLKDKCYCRAQILEIKSLEEVLVFFYDMAVVETVSMDKIQFLHRKFAFIPAFAFRIKLAGILPCGGSTMWPSLSCEKLSEIIHDNQNCKFYISKLASADENGTAIPVELWVKQSKAEGPLMPTRVQINSINRMLIEEGVALPIKNYTDKKDKMLAIEFKRQLNVHQIPQKINETDTNIKWYPISDDDQFKATIGNVTSESLEESLSEELSDFKTDDTSSSKELYLNSTKTIPKVIDWTPAMPIKNNEFVGVGSYVDHDAFVYLHSKEHNNPTLNMIELNLSDFYRKVRIKPCDLKWEAGDICIAQYHDDKKWYRARVLAVSDENIIKVEFVDYGSVEECELGTVKKRVILTHIPIQCTKCVIDGLKPNTKDGKWRTEDLDKIHAILVEKEFIVTVRERKPTHLVIQITLLHPQKQDLLSYLADFGIDIVLPDDDSKDDLEEPEDDSRLASPDVIIEKYIEEIPDGESISETLTRHEENLPDDKVISSNPVSVTSIDDNNFNENTLEIENMSWKDIEILEREVVASTPLITCKQHLVTYTSVTIPDNIDTLEIELCCPVTATAYYAQLRENTNSKTLNSYYLQYIELMTDLQKNADKQPLVQTLAANTLCCALFQDGLWYRCLIEDSVNIPGTDKTKIRLVYVDFGNDEYRTVTLETCDLHSVKANWVIVPTAAIKFQLWGVTVTPGADNKSLLTEMAKMYNKTLIAKIKERHGNFMDVELYEDAESTEIIYAPFIQKGLFQLKKTKED